MSERIYRNVKAWRQRNKRRMVAGFGDCCAICKLKDEPCVYDFHHLDPKMKDFQVSSKIMSWETTIIELTKCVMLCSCCHRKLHMELVSLPENFQRFDVSLIDSSLLETTLSRKRRRKITL